MTTSDAAKRSRGARTTPSIKVTVRLNFFIISNLLRLLRLKKPVTSFTTPCGQGRRRMEEGVDARREVIGARQTQFDPLYADSLYVAKECRMLGYSGKS